MKINTLFPKKECHKPKIFIINAKNKTLGHIATEASLLLRGKYTSLYTPGTNLSNYVIITESDKILVSGKKEYQKFYYRNSQRPGSLKKESLSNLRLRLPTKILKRAIIGMLPKSRLGRCYHKNIFIYSNKNDMDNKIFDLSSNFM